MNVAHDNRAEKLDAAIAQVEAIFQENPQAYLWILNYSITHSVLAFVVHQGDYLNGHKIVCGGCDYLAGPLQGGPYTLTLCYVPQSDNDLPAITILGNEDELVIKCNRISVPTAQKIEAQRKNGVTPADVMARIAHLDRQIVDRE